MYSTSNPQTSPLPIDLDQIVAALRAHTGLRGKAPIRTIRRFLDTSDPVHGPGDDGAIVVIGDRKIVACGEALSPPFVALDPFGAGFAAVLANVNDVAAMGGTPDAIINTIVASPDIANEIMRGLTDASKVYDVPIVGGHLTRTDGEPSLSAFAVGSVDHVLSMTNVRPGQDLIFVCSLDGHMRPDFPFFTSIDNQRQRLARDVRLFSQAANKGLALAAKDVSMAGAIGSLAMLLEFTTHGATVDLDRLPTPPSCDLAEWLVCFPTFAFWLTSDPDRTDECIKLFQQHQLEAVAVGTIATDSVLSISTGGSTAEVMNLRTESITGLWSTSE